MDPYIFVIAEWATLLVDIRCPRGGFNLAFLSISLRTSCTDEFSYCTKPMITGL